MDTFGYVCIMNLCVFYIAKVHPLFPTMVGGSLLLGQSLVVNVACN
jgi:hypothetical protein